MDRVLTKEDAEAVLGPEGQLKRESENECDLATSNPVGPAIVVGIEPLPDTWDGGEAYTYANGSIMFKKGAVEVSVITSAYNGSMSKLDAATYIARKVAGAM